MAPYTYAAFLVVCFGTGWALPWLLSTESSKLLSLHGPKFCPAELLNATQRF